MAVEAQYTDFSRDVFGRFLCNSFEEARASIQEGPNSPNGGATPFQIIIIGGGTFGGALASTLFNLDRATDAFVDPFPHFASRILVLEAGPFLLPEHGQNLPLMSLDVPSAATIAELRASGEADRPRREVWGLPWHSDDEFPGLAYCLGGRSIYWGGWSPRYLATEMPTNGNGGTARWPQRVREDLLNPGPDRRPYFDEAADELGVSDPNDFINGKLHVAMRKALFGAAASGKIRNVVPLDELPEYVNPDTLADAMRRETLERATPPGGDVGDARRALKLDAPYAVQTRTRPGFFPSNKFSSVPLLMAAERKASLDSLRTGDAVLNNSRKQLMVVPNCNVTRLLTQDVTFNGRTQRRVVAVETLHGVIPVPTNGIVVIALGAIESARLALNSFEGIPNYGQIGTNLMMHVRTNTQFFIPRDHVLFKGIPWTELEVSALQVRGRIRHEDGSDGHFHLQITASALPNQEVNNPEAQLFQKVPDLENIELVANTPKTDVAVAIRGVAEMQSKNPASSVILDPEKDAFNGMRRAFVRINDDQKREVPAIRNLTAKDAAVKTAMVEATNQVLTLFGVGPRTENSDPNTDVTQQIKLDGLGTTYHESGTLHMGEDPNDSVTDPDQRFHFVSNAYAADLSVAPTCGSANPMQPGIALVRRLARHLAAPEPPAQEQALFDGTTARLWRIAGVNSNCFGIFDDRLLMLPAQGQLGLLWCLVPTPPNFELSLEWRVSDPSENCGVFVRFPDPNKVPPDKQKTFGDPAYIAIEYGFEVQICQRDNGSPDDPDVADSRFRRTGVIYNGPRQEIDESVPIDHNGGWNRMRIVVRDQVYEVFFVDASGTARRRTRFVNDQPRNRHRGLPTREGAPSFIGLQSHFDTKETSFRNIRIKPL